MTDVLITIFLCVPLAVLVGWIGSEVVEEVFKGEFLTWKQLLALPKLTKIKAVTK